jgi:signal transduction histidine kinase
MKQHGGTIAVAGELDVGTTVTLWFPRKEEA